MRRFIDFHTHSTYSDGQTSPAELMRMAEARRLAAVALTDHDTTDGLAEARAAAEPFPQLQFVPGIEISARHPGGTLHILGLGIREDSPRLRELTERLRAAREERNPKILSRLQQMGVKIDMQDVRETAASLRQTGEGRIISRLHMAETLRRKGYVSSAKQAFTRYIGVGAPAFVDKERLEPAEAISALREAGGIAAVAHPVQLGCENRAQLERVLRGLLRAGLNGIEAHHTDHSPADTRHFLDLARRHELCVVGGSDFHGAAKPDAKLGRPRVPLAALDDRWRRILLANHSDDG